MGRRQYFSHRENPAHAGDGVRQILLRVGIATRDTLGVNPYQFGLVGSTDSHTALSTADAEQLLREVCRTRSPQ